jgi:signal transduction histidine kinase
MFTAMNRIRGHLLRILELHTADRSPPVRQRMSVAVQQILDLDLAIMLEPYREDLLAKNRNAERLATIGQFAAGIGHELRNPLSVIESSVYILRQHLGTQASEAPIVAKHFDRIAGEVKRSTDTINDLLALASSRAPVRTRTPVRTLVQAAAEASLLPAGVSVEIAVPSDLVANLDADQLRHVLAHLFINASQALSGKGRIHVAAQVTSGVLELRVRDEGPGVPEAVRSRIFEPLFTTKAQGSGIGLALCRRIADAHGGTIDLEPTNEGASFLLRIPAATTMPVDRHRVG